MHICGTRGKWVKTSLKSSFFGLFETYKTRMIELVPEQSMEQYVTIKYYLSQVWLTTDELIIWEQFYRKFSRYESLKYVWNLHIQNYNHLSQWPVVVKKKPQMNYAIILPTVIWELYNINFLNQFIIDAVFVLYCPGYWLIGLDQMTLK